ncbi:MULTISPECIES: cupin domain-containing protein [Paraburkholderia]|jgi:quercetin dioxygenase-like cupin family protein|uniref:Cupin domain protein n=1 Tax=Paraburkholderia phenazinium TaxID=60549 RepID=A0A1N6K6E8_9BURK|nr:MULTISPECIES: cupin domain-containing protein [Paraburkholderia]SIO51866.1 Cupin domain protein [Paraburkholderia phenazinium]
MKVFHGRTDGAKSELRGETFSGEVWADPVMPATDGVTINTVLFAPRGRTYWHTHEYGQVLTVTAGKGWICKDGEAPQPIRQGDIVFIGPNERHWHGASDSSYMVHIATSLGKATWQEEVAEKDYPAGV